MNGSGANWARLLNLVVSNRTTPERVMGCKDMKAAKLFAVRSIMIDYNNYECRKNKFSTLYRKCFYDKGSNSFRIIGHAHNYSYSV